MWRQEVEAGSAEDTRTSETGNIPFILVHPAPVIHPLLFQDHGQRSYKAAVRGRGKREGSSAPHSMDSRSGCFRKSSPGCPSFV